MKVAVFCALKGFSKSSRITIFPGAAASVIVIAPLLMRYGIGVFRTDKLGLHVLRAILNVLSMLAFFVGLSMTPIARATALSFTAPLFTALLGVVFLGEIFRWRRFDGRRS